MGLVRRRAAQGGSDRWPDVELRAYGTGQGASRRKQIVVGPDDGARNFAMRVFQLAPGASSNEEEHPHDHGVLIMPGRARVLLGQETHEVGPGDVVWVSPNERHRFDCVGPEMLQFLCVVPGWGEPDARNPLPVPVDESLKTV